ncbi:MAG: hypothetical protein GY906_07270 [bacterium]|nr:hypothetical protein [bacterium]
MKLRPAVMLFLTLALLAPHGSGAAERMTLEDANLRWSGAQCQSRAQIILSGKVDRKGVVNSQWMVWLRPGVTNPNAPPAAKGRFVFSSGDSLLRKYGSGAIPEATLFEVVGWNEEKRGGPIYLEVQLPGLPAGGRLYFYTPKPPPFNRKLKLKHLADCERWARFEVFEIVEAPDEQLVEVGTPTEQQPPSPGLPAAVHPPTPVVATQVFDPAVTLHAVAVQPAQVVPGGEVLLVLTYQISGVPPNSQFEVTERRRLTFDGRELTSFDEQVARGAGSFTSKLPVRLPTDAAMGFYGVEASVELAGVIASGTAFFQVIR